MKKIKYVVSEFLIVLIFVPVMIAVVRMLRDVVQAA